MGEDLSSYDEIIRRFKYFFGYLSMKFGKTDEKCYSQPKLRLLRGAGARL